MQRTPPQKKESKKCQHPNETFFERMGKLDDAASKVSKSPFLMIRHAISTYNVISERVKKDIVAKMPGDSAEIKLQRRESEMEEFGDWNKNADLIDSFIEGTDAIKQCSKTQPLLNEFQFVKILVSPLRRTIQTAVKILESHPILTSGQGVTFVLFPYVRESVTYTNLSVSRKDLEVFIEQIVEKYPMIQFDFRYLDSLAYREVGDGTDPVYHDELIRGNHDLWLIHVLSDENLKVELLKEIAKRYRESNSTDIRHVYDVIKDKQREFHGRPMESNSQIYDRAQKIKQLLVEEGKETEITSSSEKILVVTHAKTLRALMASAVEPEKNCPVPNYRDGEFVDSYNPHNCEIIPFKFEDQ